MPNNGIDRGDPSLIERRVQRIINARSVTLGLAATLLGLALVGAVAMRIADEHNFPSLGLAFWWALETVTTVGYGDVVPTNDIGRLVASVEMVLGISFVALLTAGVTSTVVRRDEAAAEEAERARDERGIEMLVDGLAAVRHDIAALRHELGLAPRQPSDDGG
jgi:voltage-gated potassium channel Kch